MPTRMLRDGILRSERVDQLSPLAELFYRRLMSVVDDYGRYYASPKLLRVDCYPLKEDITSSAVEIWLAECQAAELLALYSVAGKAFLEISDFGQRVRDAPSRFPGPQLPSRADARALRASDGGARASDGGARASDGGARASDGGARAD